MFSGYGSTTGGDPFATHKANERKAGQPEAVSGPFEPHKHTTAVGARGPFGVTLQTRSTPRGMGQFSRPELFALVLIPWSLFLLICLLFAFVYHAVPALVWVIALFIALLCQSSLRVARKQVYPSGFYVSLLSAAALAASTFVGFVANDVAILQYWHYDAAFSYINVLPSEPAAGFTDAGKILFASEARLDKARTMGFKDRSVFCVAPVVGDDSVGHISFWAVGTNCCSMRSNFNCDDAWNPKARSGLVVDDISHFWGNERDQYMKSVRQAEAAYSINSVEEPIFVRWVQDPERFQHNYWAIGVGILVAASTAHLVFSCACTGLIHYGGKGLL